MTNDDNIRDDKVQYNNNREAANISALSSSKAEKFKYLTGEEILPLAKIKKIKQPKFTFRKNRRISTYWNKRFNTRMKSRFKLIEGHFPKGVGTN